MSDDAVDKFFDEMVSPASTPAESTPPDEADKRYAVVKWVFANAASRVVEVRVPLEGLPERYAPYWS